MFDRVLNTPLFDFKTLQRIKKVLLGRVVESGEVNHFNYIIQILIYSGVHYLLSQVKERSDFWYSL